MTSKAWWTMLLLALGLVLHLLLGEVSMGWSEWMQAIVGKSTSSLHSVVLWEIRIPRALTAISAGILLGWLGMLMQTWFRNPLAGPSVLGITSGGSLGVAMSVLLGLAFPAWMAAAGGCLLVLGLIGLGAKRFASPVTTLVFGLMISYAVGATVTVLQSSASAESLQTFVFWGMGTFGKATLNQATICLIAVMILGGWLFWRASWLDMWTLGEDLAQTMGVPRSRLQSEILLLTGLMVGLVTSICGPLAFLGLATPHVYRFFHAPRSHRAAMLGIGVWGAVLALAADGLVRWTDANGGFHWPLNAVLAMLGAPVVVMVLWKRNHDWS